MDFIDDTKSESLGNPRAESFAKARGIWQFMYWTGKKYGLNVDNKSFVKPS